MSLNDAIEDARQYFDDPPPNESCTCEWIILPLLRATGYAPRDIVSRLADSNKQFPDYTLLPQASHATWYLEAKDWNLTLEDTHAHQALNYANHNGKRWVVLTNGREWRLYDNDIRGVAGEKLIMQAELKPDTTACADEVIDFLTSLSKSNILAGDLAGSVTTFQSQQQTRLVAASREAREAVLRRERESVARQRLAQILPQQLQDEASELVQQMCVVLKQQDGLSEVTNELLAQWFQERLASGSTSLLSSPAATFASISPSSARTSNVPAFIPNVTTGDVLALAELAQRPIDGKLIRPVLLTLPDNSRMSVRSWVDMAYQTVAWFYRQGKRPQMPFAGYNVHRHFLNTSDHHPHSPMRGPKTISVGSYVVYMDSDMTGKHFAERLVALCQATDVNPNDIKVTLS